MMAPLAELLGVGGVPCARSAARRWLARHHVREERTGPGARTLYDADTLPEATHAAFLALHGPAPEQDAPDLEARFFAQTAERREEAEARAAALRRVAVRRATGETLAAACDAEAAAAGCSGERLEEMHRMVREHDPREWAWRLVKIATGRPRKDDDADLLFSRFCRKVAKSRNRFSFTKAYDLVVQEHVAKGPKKIGYCCIMKR